MATTPESDRTPGLPYQSNRTESAPARADTTEAALHRGVGASNLSNGRRRTAVVGLIVALAATAGLVLLVTEVSFGLAAMVSALLVAFAPLPAYLAIFLLMDRFEPEPRWMLAIAFLWGASVAVVGAGFLNGMADILAGESVSTIVLTPVIEETVKAFVLFAFFFMKPDEFDGVIDGVIYAAMVGLGFALMENVEYYGNALVQDGPRGLAVTFTLRGVMAPFSHPLFTAMSGVGMGIAQQTHRRWIRIAAPPAGLIAAITLHALWNAGASAGCVFFAIYAIVMVPLLVALAALVGFSLRREGRIVAVRLAPEVASGQMAPAELQRLASMSERARESLNAWSRGGRAALRASRSYHHAASELAFLRQRAARDKQPPDPAQEAEHVLQLQAARQDFRRVVPSMD